MNLFVNSDEFLTLQLHNYFEDDYFDIFEVHDYFDI